MSKKKQEESANPVGRPVVYKGIDRKPVTIQLPADLVAYIDATADNRTKWIIDTLQERRKREEGKAG